jgi:hypothetical protein
VLHSMASHRRATRGLPRGNGLPDSRPRRHLPLPLC